MMKSDDIKVVATNRKARHDFFLEDQIEAGLSLRGTEIKSIRAGQVSLKEAHIEIDGSEAWLVNAHIAPYESAGQFNHEPKRRRRLLLHKREIHKLFDQVRQKGYTIVPIRLYLRHGKAKLEIALAKGKRKFDKRKEISKRDAEREIERTLARRGRE
jgi:SsrA-binding protein